MQMLQQQQQARQNQMQPGGMDPNRERPSSPVSGENAPSPSKRQRIEGAPFNPNQPGVMMANGRPVQNMPGQPMGGPNPANAAASAHQLLAASGINPSSLNASQLQQFIQAPPGAQQKSIAAYSQNLQQHHGSQMPNKQMPNAPQGQGSPSMMQNAPELAAFYNTPDIGGPGRMPPGANGGPPNPPGAGSNHALQDYQMQLMLLEQQNKKRLMMARQEQDNMPGNPGGPQVPGGPFPDASPQAMRTGTSPNPADQMKRGTPQLNNSGIPSPVPEGGQSRESPTANMNFMGNVDPNMPPQFMAQAAQMNGMRPPSSHPGQQYNGQLNPQMMAARQQQQQPGQGNPQQWQQQQGPNGQMVPQGVQQNQPVQGTPQQRAMPPPSAPAAGGNAANGRTTASPQQAAAAPPTPNQTNKSGPKKKESKAAKDKVRGQLYCRKEMILTPFASGPHRRSRTRTSTTRQPPLPRTPEKGTPRLRQLPSPPSTRATCPRVGRTEPASHRQHRLPRPSPLPPRLHQAACPSRRLATRTRTAWAWNSTAWSISTWIWPTLSRLATCSASSTSTRSSMMGMPTPSRLISTGPSPAWRAARSGQTRVRLGERAVGWGAFYFNSGSRLISGIIRHGVPAVLLKSWSCGDQVSGTRGLPRSHAAVDSEKTGGKRGAEGGWSRLVVVWLISCLPSSDLLFVCCLVFPLIVLLLSLVLCFRDEDRVGGANPPVKMRVGLSRNFFQSHTTFFFLRFFLFLLRLAVLPLL